METTYFVYLLTFANGKVYVGMSKTDAKGGTRNRFRQHGLAAKNGKDNPVYRAWRKYGEPQHVILTTHTTREDCALAEIAAIQAYDSMNPAKGYNLMPGGQGMHAPPGSAIYELMRAKVWDNPERRRKSSEALKGRVPDDVVQLARDVWNASPECAAHLAEVARRPEVRAAASQRMYKRLDTGFRDFLRDSQIGKPKNFAPEAKARIAAGRHAYLHSAEGQARNRKLMQDLRAQPENEAKRKAAHAEFLASDWNKDHCRAMAAKVSKPVKDLATGEVFPSGRAAAKARGVSGPTILHWIKKGKFAYV